MAMQNNNQRESPRGQDEEGMLPLKDPDRRPPQLNMQICGCQCGCVSRGPGGDGGGGRNEEADLDYRKGEEGADDESIGIPKAATPLGPVQHLFTEYADYQMDESGGFQLGIRNMNWEYPFKEVTDTQERIQPESLAMHLHQAEAVSVYSSGPRTRRSDSPGPAVFTAIGTWTTTPSYVFNPLSLTPQHIIPRDARLAMVGQDVYPGSIESEDLKDECHC